MIRVWINNIWRDGWGSGFARNLGQVAERQLQLISLSSIMRSEERPYRQRFRRPIFAKNFAMASSRETSMRLGVSMLLGSGSGHVR